MNKVDSKKIKGLFTIEPKVFGDHRGYFSEVWKKEWFTDHDEFIQENQSLSEKKNTLRGLHLQKGDHAQAKLVRVLKGTIIDYVVDLRKDSPTFGEYEAFELSESNMKQLYVPRGFGHGFITQEDNTIVNYKVDNKYNKDSEVSLDFFDEGINIDFDKKLNYVVSEKDAEGISLEAFKKEID